MKTILVFKTSVVRHEEVRRLQGVLDRTLGENERWNFDLEDCDHILRVESRSTPAHTIQRALQTSGYRCEELED